MPLDFDTEEERLEKEMKKEFDELEKEYKEAERRWKEEGAFSEAAKVYNESPTGSLRTNVGKVDPTHLAPDFIMEMAKVLSANEHKYPKFNYAKGQEYSMTMASLLRHSLNLLNGEDIDPTDGCHNAAKIAVNAMIVWCTYKYHVKNYPQLDDRFKKVLGLE